MAGTCIYFWNILGLEYIIYPYLEYIPSKMDQVFPIKCEKRFCNVSRPFPILRDDMILLHFHEGIFFRL